MEAQSLLLILGVFLLAAAFVAQPFFGAARPSPALDRTRSRLMAEQERLLNALRELDFDHSLGKVPAEDYPLQRAELVRQGAEVIRQLDELPPSRGRARQAQAAASVTDDAIEERITSRRSERREKAGGFCPNCGKVVLAADRFCSHCGKVLQ
jgi:hypothetical protein